MLKFSSGGTQSATPSKSILELQAQKLRLIQNRILILSMGVLAPMAVGVMIWSHYRANDAALDPVAQQVRQGLQTGDEISIQRAAHSLLNLPQTVSVTVTSNQGTVLLHQQNTNHSGFGSYTIKRTATDSFGAVIGSVETRFALQLQMILLVLFLIAAVAVVILYGIRPVLFQSFAELTSGIQHLPKWIQEGTPKEILIAELDFAYRELLRLRKTETEAVRLQAHQATSLQVAHDIRSPLSALEMISNHLGELPEDVRTVIRGSIQRIRDIANTLSNTKKLRLATVVETVAGAAAGADTDTSHSALNTETPAPSEPVFLFPLVDAMVSEKRVENRQHFDLAIEFEPDHLAYGLFAAVDSVELKRVISNILNNSIEAILMAREGSTARTRRVTLQLDSVREGEQDYAQIKILDEGPGIPAEVLAQLGTPGVSFGKENGSGLGLAHAFTQVRGWKGDIRVQSAPAAGTEVAILLPLAPPPAWYLPKIEIKPSEIAIVIDDEPTIHQLFRRRLGSNLVVSATRTQELESAIRKFKGGIFLVDYEFQPSSDWPNTQNGFDLIDRYHLAPHAVLVTSHFENPTVIRECTRRGIRLLPKPMARVVPVSAGAADQVTLTVW